jgi:hypothetical protein
LFAENTSNRITLNGNTFLAKMNMSTYPTAIAPRINSLTPRFNNEIVLENGLNQALNTAIMAKNDNNTMTQGIIVASVEEMKNGRFEINLSVEVTVVDSNGRSRKLPSVNGTIGFADRREILDDDGNIDNNKVKNIANDIINIVRETTQDINNIDGVK